MRAYLLACFLVWVCMSQKMRKEGHVLLIRIIRLLPQYTSPACTVERIQELMRPYLHEFLTVAYVHFDIVIWCMGNLSFSFFGVRQPFAWVGVELAAKRVWIDRS